MRALVMLGALTALTSAGPAHGDALDDQARAVARTLFRQHIAPRVQDNVPLTASSASFAFTWNSDSDVWERSATTTGSIFLERAETIGKGYVSVNVSYGYVKYNAINGRSLYSDLTKRDPNGVLFTYRIRDAEVQLVNVGATVGIANDAELSLTIPIERIYFAGQFIVEPPVLAPSTVVRRDHFGVGDLVLRGKWLATRSDYANGALGLSLKVPSGDYDRGLSQGDTLLTPAVYVSRTFGDWIEPHVNLGVETNLAEFRDSRLSYAAGATMQLLRSQDWLAPRVSLTLDFLGRVDLAPPEHRNRGSFFGTNRQENIVDFAPGFKLSLWEGSLLSFAVQIPMNDDGLRADVVPVGGVEYVF